MVHFIENIAETQATFEQAVLEHKKRNSGPNSDRAKFQISTNRLKNGFNTDRFIIFGESKIKYEKFRNAMINDLQPRNYLENHDCFLIIMDAWNLIRLNIIRTGLTNMEIRNVLSNTYNYDDAFMMDRKEINKTIKETKKYEEMYGIVYRRDCVGEGSLSKLDDTVHKTTARYVKMKNDYIERRFGKEEI